MKGLQGKDLLQQAFERVIQAKERLNDRLAAAESRGE